jgi:chromate reductase
VVAHVQGRAASYGAEAVTHSVIVYDPSVVFAPDGALAESGAHLKAPHFFYSKDEAPAGMEEMAKNIADADSFIIVTAEYNHSVPPGLLAMLDHFGGSKYAYKPCGIVTYSAGPWGGMRAAMALRPVLAELGAFSISALCGFPSAGDLFEQNGAAKDPENRMLKQLPKMLDQLEWTALAMLKQKELCPPP